MQFNTTTGRETNPQQDAATTILYSWQSATQWHLAKNHHLDCSIHAAHLSGPTFKFFWVPLIFSIWQNQSRTKQYLKTFLYRHQSYMFQVQSYLLRFFLSATFYVISCSSSFWTCKLYEQMSTASNCYNQTRQCSCSDSNAGNLIHMCLKRFLKSDITCFFRNRWRITNQNHWNIQGIVETQMFVSWVLSLHVMIQDRKTS